jgi:hypothetical protein
MIRVLSGIVILLLLACGMWLGSRWMLADVSYTRVMSTLDTWRDNGAVTSLEDWELSRLQVDKLIAQQPDDPDFYRLLGLLHEWRSFAVNGEEITFNEILASRRQAVEAYRQAARLRPAQPDGWTHLARLKILSGERDEEFRLALGNAINQGGNESGNIQEVAYITSLSWTTIEEDTALKTLVLDTLARSLQGPGNPRGILNYLDGKASLAALCEVLDLELAGREVQAACGG